MNGEMTLDKQLSLIREAAELGLESLHLSGGEPTIHHGLEKMVEEAAGCGIRTRVITNGYDLDPERIRRLRDCGLDCFMFSIDGMEAVHNRLRRRTDSFQRVLEAVACSLDCGMTTRVNIVVWRDNRHDVIPLLRACKEMNVDIFSGFLGSPVGRASSLASKVLNPREWKDLLYEVGDFVSLDNSSMSVVFEKADFWLQEDTIDLQAIHGCGAGCVRTGEENEYLIVASNGEIFPCVFFMHAAPPLGSLARMSLREALQTAPGRNFYRLIAQPLPECAECPYVIECNSGCRGYSMSYYNNFFRRDPRCSIDVANCDHFPLCPIMKINLNTGSIDGSTDAVV